MRVTFAYLIEPPFNDRATDGRVIGCDVELAQHVLTEAGVTEIDMVETEFAALLPGLSDDRWDMTTGLFPTDDRRKIADFSRPIWALPDGLLVAPGNPLGLTGYVAIAKTTDARIAVIRDQVQHQTALDLGVPEARISIFETYEAAAKAVQTGDADAYASVAKAHLAFAAKAQDWAPEVVTVAKAEKTPAVGAFAFKPDSPLRAMVEAALSDYLGSPEHRAMMERYEMSAAIV